MDTTDKNIKGFAKRVIIGGVSGVMLGSSSMATIGDAIMENGTLDADTSDKDFNYENMSFGEAFATARGELGPDGIFEWHGNIYSTCTAEEWAASHPSESLEEVAPEEDAFIFVEDSETGDVSPEDEVEILGMEDDADDIIEVEIETANDINGDEATFVEIEEAPQSDAMADIYVGPDNNQSSDNSEYPNDEISMI